MKLSSPFFHHAKPTSQVMLLVCLALLPGSLVQIYFFGFGVLINLLACAVFAVSAEYVAIKLRSRDPMPIIKDNSALLTGLLLGVALPPTLPIWMTFVGVWFAILCAKQLYGGLGFNPFNPAMVGYVLLLISFPVEMTAWLPSRELSNLPGLWQSIQLIFVGTTSDGLTAADFRLLADGFSMATPLDFVKTEYTLGHMTQEIFAMERFEDNLKGWAWVNLGFLAGGLYLMAVKIIRPHIPFAFLAGIVATSGTLYLFDDGAFTSPMFHLTAGATMLGAFFIATDPVSASTTPRGRLIYGFAIGFFVVIIRSFGGYPEAVAFSVLLLNLATPTIDHYTKPAIYGHQGDMEDVHD